MTKLYKVDVLETWHRTGYVKANSEEEVKDIVLATDPDNLVEWDDAEYLCDQYDANEYMTVEDLGQVDGPQSRK